MESKEARPMDGCKFIMDLLEIILGEDSLRVGVSCRSILTTHAWSTC